MGSAAGSAHLRRERPPRLSTTFSLTAMKSTISAKHSPTNRSAPPRPRQRSPRSITMRSRGAPSAVRDLPRRMARRPGPARLDREHQRTAAQALPRSLALPQLTDAEIARRVERLNDTPRKCLE
jgi:hypothetical protein